MSVVVLCLIILLRNSTLKHGNRMNKFFYLIFCVFFLQYDKIVNLTSEWGIEVESKKSLCHLLHFCES